MTRHTVYISTAVARQLDDAAEAIARELRDLVPKHRVLGALITAGLGQSAGVAASLRAELMSDLGGK